MENKFQEGYSRVLNDLINKSKENGHGKYTYLFDLSTLEIPEDLIDYEKLKIDPEYVPKYTVKIQANTIKPEYRKSENSNITRNMYMFNFLAHKLVTSMAHHKELVDNKEHSLKLLDFSPVEKKEHSPEELELIYQTRLSINQEMIYIFDKIYFDKPLDVTEISVGLREIFKSWADSLSGNTNEEFAAICIFSKELLELFPEE